MAAELSHDKRALKNLIEKALAPNGKMAFALLELTRSSYYEGTTSMAKADEERKR
jgi:hypothetical protein